MSSQSAVSSRIVQKLWSFCHVLRDDGLSYPDYVEQLTYFLFLKMDDERRLAGERTSVPGEYGWSTLLTKRGPELRAHYKATLENLGKQTGMLGLIFRGAHNRIRDPAKLEKLIELINREQWYELDADVKGDAYEGLLDKTSQDSKSGAGQYFTPRPLIEAIVAVVCPKLSESFCDPACGTGGFLLAIHRYLREMNPVLSKKDVEHLRHTAYQGTELVESVGRLAAMNLYLHGIGPDDESIDPPILVQDSLVGKPISKFDVVLTNPPFGRKSSMAIDAEEVAAGRDGTSLQRPDFIASTANKQLNFLQHVHSLLKDGGRAAVVVPDNVLFEGGAAEIVRRHLLKNCALHTLLRLPTGIFYAQGVKANVLFFEKRRPRKGERLWVYDLRSGIRVSLKNNPLSYEDLRPFVESYAKRDSVIDTSELSDRWKSFDPKDLLGQPGCRLDISWSTRTTPYPLTSARDLSVSIVADLRNALSEIEAIQAELDRE